MKNGMGNLGKREMEKPEKMMRDIKEKGDCTCTSA